MFLHYFQTSKRLIFALLTAKSEVLTAILLWIPVFGDDAVSLGEIVLTFRRVLLKF
jgi:hypothetical protein